MSSTRIATSSATSTYPNQSGCAAEPSARTVRGIDVRSDSVRLIRPVIRQRVARRPRSWVAVSRSPHRRHDLPGHPAPAKCTSRWASSGHRSTTRTGMAELAGVDRETITAVVATLQPAAGMGAHHLDVVQGDASRRRSWRPRRRPPARPNPRSSPGPTLEQWRADARGLRLDRAAFDERARRGVRPRAPRSIGRAGDAAARIEKAAFTRADLVEVIGAQVPVDTERSPREVVEAAVDEVGMRVTAPRAAHQREGL